MYATSCERIAFTSCLKPDYTFRVVQLFCLPAVLYDSMKKQADSEAGLQLGSKLIDDKIWDFVGLKNFELLCICFRRFDI
jgi:hypothetical protein